ncbi:GNAT family N-acetyltransferase [Streptomyces sp. NEAU-Y11]|uniref:GNAT family N-acetyltransferase n=1 Tax=Streptomyces cucumeris TaxID=2962890 RepID=UPI0020C8D5DE|nr:GNAT family protein [Streptomyces sp. NEAU-Y11]MCP9210399.1 GNAT family N-acetyltransferase [Streptomyces sp. NEAU-Y11]
MSRTGTLIETPRLRLRVFRDDDVDVFCEYRSHPDVARYQGWSVPVSREAGASDIREFGGTDPAAPGWFLYAIEAKASGLLIGEIGVHLHENMMQADIGFTLAPAHQGMGLATEATAATVDSYLARGLRRISADCDARNIRSAALLERVGFRFEGLRTSNRYAKGEWIDELFFGMVSEYRQAT